MTIKLKFIRPLPKEGDKCDFLFNEYDDFKFMTPYHMFVKYVTQGDIVRLESPMDKILVPYKNKTMHNTYGEPNDELGKHICCDACGMCKTCNDCECIKKKYNEKEWIEEGGCFNGGNL